MVMDIHHRRSPLVQGGLEIPIQVTVEMDLIEKNRQCLDKYETLVGEKYKEPVDGKFEDATDSILQRLKEPEECGEDTDSNSDLDIDHALLFLINRKYEITFMKYYIFAGIKYCDFDLNRKIRN